MRGSRLLAAVSSSLFVNLIHERPATASATVSLRCLALAVVKTRAQDHVVPALLDAFFKELQDSPAAERLTALSS